MKLKKYANQYAKQSNWTDFALLKVCVGAVGIIIGLCVPKENKKPALLGASALFSLSFCPLMIKLCKILVNDIKD